jgi:hypothetical protein
MPNRRHLTAIEDAAVHESGWVALPGTSLEVVRLPLVDMRLALPSGMPMFARLDYRSALAWCERHGCRLIDKLELDAYREASTVLRPVLLPDAAQRQASPRRPGESNQAWDGRLRAGMTTVAWSERHDTKVWEQLSALSWNGTTLIFGAGKHWIRGAPKGRSWLMGWWRGSETPARNEYWQKPPQSVNGPHDDRHHDYGTTTLVVRDGTGIPAGDGAHGPGGAADTDGSDDQAPAELTVTLAPHGYRISVRELVEDARALGTWRPLGAYTPKPGDLAISARDGGDPTRGGTGHVERVESLHADHVVTIGGNELNTWLRSPLKLDDPALRGWICYPDALALAALEAARAELGKGIVEIPGPKSHPAISAYLAPCRRGGGPRAGMPAPDGTVERGGNLVGLTSDETFWCAAAASACCFAGLRT